MKPTGPKINCVIVVVVVVVVVVVAAATAAAVTNAFIFENCPLYINMHVFRLLLNIRILLSYCQLLS